MVLPTPAPFHYKNEKKKNLKAGTVIATTTYVLQFVPC